MTDIITASEKLACARRELNRRQRIYPGMHKAGKVSAGFLVHEIGCMEAIVHDYERIMIELEAMRRNK
jgi:hypothetical protein